MATNLLKLFLGQGLARDFLDLLFQLELGRTSEAWEGVACLRVQWKGEVGAKDFRYAERGEIWEAFLEEAAGSD